MLKVPLLIKPCEERDIPPGVILHDSFLESIGAEADSSDMRSACTKTDKCSHNFKGPLRDIMCLGVALKCMLETCVK